MWSMPRSVLRIVAVMIAACAVIGFVLGIRGAPDKPRLPGEGLPGSGAVPLQAADATPLSEEAPPPPPPKPPEQKPDEATDTVAAEAAAAAAKLPSPVIKPAPTAALPGAEDHVGDLIDGLTPPPQEDPPH